MHEFHYIPRLASVYRRAADSRCPCFTVESPRRCACRARRVRVPCAPRARQANQSARWCDRGCARHRTRSRVSVKWRHHRAGACGARDTGSFVLSCAYIYEPPPQKSPKCSFLCFSRSWRFLNCLIRPSTGRNCLRKTFPVLHACSLWR